MSQISIIVPVYNAAKYLSRTIASIQAQTFEDWELLFVNDGSTDNSAEIIEGYATKDARIKLIHQKNLGPARARNVGMNNAQGQYISFVDSDDTIEPHMMQCMYDTAIRYQAHIVMCNFAIISGSRHKRTESHHDFTCDCIMTQNQLVQEVLKRYFEGNSAGVPSLCNKIFDLKWLRSKGIIIPEDRVRAEDWMFNLNCMEAEPRFCAIDDVLYNYWQNEGSIMHSVRENEWKQHFESMQILYEVNVRHGLHYEQDIATQCVNGSIGHLLCIYANKPVRIDIAEQIMHYIDLHKVLKDVDINSLSKAFKLIAIALKIKQYWIVKILLKIFTKKW